MGKLLIILILIYSFFKLARYLLFWNVKEQQASRNRQTRNKKEGEVSINKPQKREKHISSDEGEYVDFEEIK